MINLDILKNKLNLCFMLTFLLMSTSISASNASRFLSSEKSTLPEIINSIDKANTINSFNWTDIEYDAYGKIKNKQEYSIKKKEPVTELWRKSGVIPTDVDYEHIRIFKKGFEMTVKSDGKVEFEFSVSSWSYFSYTKLELDIRFYKESNDKTEKPRIYTATTKVFTISAWADHQEVDGSFDIPSKYAKDACTYVTIHPKIIK